MRTEHIETVIIGAGQAGLATAHYLQRLGRPCVVLDSASRVGDGWRQQWDSLRLFSPAWADGLPGMAFPAPRWAFPTKDEFADYLEAYAVRFRLPVRLDTRVVKVSPLPNPPEASPDASPGASPDALVGSAGYVVTTAAGQIHADNVVLATGTFGRTPHVPSFADQLDPSIRQVHSSQYRRASQLPKGTVLVVGAAHSGCDIAHEVAATHDTVLAGPDTGQIPVPFGSPLFKVVFPTMLFVFRHVLTRSNPLGRKAKDHFRHGGPRLRIQQRDLAERGVDWVPGRVVGAKEGLPLLDDGRVVDARTVVWCTGFRQAFDWVELPVFDEQGWPREFRGVPEGVAGLYFCGLQFQYAGSSMLIYGAGRDAKHVASRIAASVAGRAADRAGQERRHPRSTGQSVVS
jgi:putative flavoprotein involved in K+ transport